MDASRNFEQLLKTIPALRKVTTELNTAGIRYGLFAGAYVSVITSHRPAKDADFLVHEDDFGRVRSLFAGSPEKKMGYSNFLHPYGEEKIELMTMADYEVSGVHTSFGLSDLAWRHTSLLEGKDFAVRLCDPVETILLKAMLQRGVEEGKHDLEDIQALLRVVKIDREYLNDRLGEVKAGERIAGVLRKFGLL